MISPPGEKSTYVFPRGKFNEGESKADCAIREVKEEVGYEISRRQLKNAALLECDNNGHVCSLYVVPNVPSNASFQPTSRNEVSVRNFFGAVLR